MGLSRTVSEVTAITVENRKFAPRVFSAPLKGFAYEFRTDARVQKLEGSGYRAEKQV